MEIHQTDEPPPESGCALIRVRCVGICGTDYSIFAGKIPVVYPRILGHEVFGEVLSAPDGWPQAGSRVLLDPAVACGRCPRCLESRQNICSNGWLLGRDRDGGLRDMIVVPARNLHAIPEGIADHVAPLIQVLTTCIHGQRLVHIFPGDSVAIVGLGVTGLLHVQLARLRGASPIVGVTRSEEKRDLALQLGADIALAADDPRAEELIREATGGGADLVIEAVGTVGTLARAVEIARPGGQILAYGTIGETEGVFPFYNLYHKELDVISPRAALREDFPTAIGAAELGSIRLELLVTSRVPFEDLPAALGASVNPRTLKTVVEA